MAFSRCGKQTIVIVDVMMNLRRLSEKRIRGRHNELFIRIASNRFTFFNFFFHFLTSVFVIFTLSFFLFFSLFFSRAGSNFSPSGFFDGMKILYEMDDKNGK